MPSSGGGYAATTLQSPQPSQMEPGGGSRRLLEESETMAQEKPGIIYKTGETSAGVLKAEKKVLDKRSLDYIVRSGVAGGLAGCAVSMLLA